MQYAEYRKKMIKLANVLGVLKRFRVLIICACLLVVALITVLLSVRGTVYEVSSCPQEITYGDNLGFKAKAVMGGIKYQYSADGENWSSVQPVRAGSYKVRPYSKDVSGKPRYGKEHEFIIKPKAIEVRAADYAVYGDNPSLVADLSYADRIYCSAFGFGDRYAETTEVTPDKNSVVITDENGADVTSSYIVTTVQSEITLKRRAITVAAASAEKEYDGTPLTAEGHDFRDNTSLAEGDTISYAGCEGSQTEAGSGQNEIAGEIKIYNERGVDITDRYEVTTAYGSLTVGKRKVTVNSGSAEKEYDGAALTCLEFSDDGRLLSGHSLQVVTFATLINAGEKDNALGFKVAGLNGKDESANYEIQLEAGTLTVTRRQVTVTTEDMSWTYDGTAHSCAEYYDTTGTVADNEEIIATAISSITDVGSIENVCEMRAYNYKTKTDTTANYDITVLYGTLTVKAAQLTIYSEDYDWVYDGAAHGWSGYEQEGLAGIHTVVSTAVSKITDVGTCENEIEVKVYSGSSDVTSNYDIEYFWGQLEITPRPVIVKADDAEKIYDGESLTCETVSADNLAPGHTVSGESMGSRVDAGEGENVVLRGSVVIRDGSGKDVTSNYEITFASGVLKVVPRPLTVTSESAEKIYDGDPLVCKSYKITSDLTPVYVWGHSVKVESYIEICEVGTITNALTVKFYGSNNTDVTANYDITYVYGTLKISRRPITVTTYSSGGHIYDGTPFRCEKYDLTSSLSPALVKDHYEKVTFTGGQIDAGTSKNTADVKVLTADEIDVTSNYVVTVIEGDLYVAKRDVTIISYGGEWEYDGGAHSRNAFRISEEKGYGLAEGDAVEILSVTEIVDVGSTQNVISLKINSTTRNNKDVTANYNISYERGILTVTKRPVTVTADSAEKIYDGAPLVCGTVTSSNKPVVTGHTVSARTTGSQTAVGESANRVVEGTVAIYDSNGVNVTKNYQITLGEGVLKVTQRAITVKAGDAEKIYDGNPLTCSVYAVVSEEKLLSGHKLTAVTSGSLTNAGEGTNYILPSSVKITDGSGRDITASYTVITEDGILTVKPRPVTVVADSAEKEYDGTPLTCGGYKVFSVYDPALVKDHTITAVVSGSQTAAGDGINSVESVVITSASGDVTANYAIAAQYGTLKVNGKKLTVTTESGEFVYDGESHDFSGFTYEGLLEGHTITNDYLHYFLDAGEYSNYNSVTISDGEEDVTDCYDITYVYGTVTVKKREVHATTGDGEWVYDGIPHSIGYAEVDSDSPYKLVEGHEFTYSDCAEITTVGEAYNNLVLGVSKGEYDLTSNYDLRLTFGTLKVTKRPVTLTYRYDEIYFTGAPLNKSVTCGYYSYFESVSEYPLLKETYVTVTVLCDEYCLGEATLYFQEGSARITDYNKKDLTGNYEITLQSKQVGIVKRTIKLNSAEAEKVYDGTPLTAERCGVDDSAAKDNPFVSYSLISGHELCDVELTFTGSQTEIGESLNTFTVDSFKVVDADGNDITYGYTVEENYGGLYVTEFGSLGVATAGASKIYDGTPLTMDKYTIFHDTLLEGYTYEITVTGSRTEVGSSRNTYDIVVYSPQGDDVTAGLRLVDPVKRLGVLTVLGKEPNGNDGDLDLSGGLGGGGSSSAVGDTNTVALKLYSEYSGQAYMRLLSYGDYTGNGWNPANPYAETIDGKYGMNYLTGFALGGAGKQSYKMQVEVTGSMYYLPYYLAAGDYGYEVQQSDVLYSGDTSVIYSLYYYPYNYLTDGAASVNSNVSEAELAYRQFVYDNYLSVPESTAEYLKTVISAQGFKITDKNLVTKIAAFVQSCATYNLDYNTALDDESDGVVSFLRDYKEGVCRHYASAATLLYRMMGIPARYTVGYAGETVAGEWVEITAAEAHAWVEIYVDGTGWVQIEVTGSSDGGNSEVINLGRLIPADVTKEYDGTPLIANRLIGTPELAEILIQGYTVTAQFGGSQTNVGVSYSSVMGVAVYDPDGKPVLNVKWTTGTGKLTVVRAGSLITVHLYYLGCEYDGKGHSLGKDDWYAEGLPAGFEMQFDPSSIVVTEVRGFDWEAVKALPLKLYNASGFEVTSNYNIIFSYDSAEGCDGEGIDISRRQITVCTQTAEKEYDGTPLKNSGWWISFGTLAAGHTIDVEVIGSITDAGSAVNEIGSYSIYDAEGNDVSRNYQLNFKRGTLTVID